MGAGPWQNDINSAFADDPAVVARVDQFMRERYQPRMTQLEQQAAEAATARRLYDAFQEDPQAAYASVTNELYGPEAAGQALSALEAALQTRSAPVPPAPVAPVQAAPQAPAADPRVESMLSDWESQKAQAAYDTAVDGFVSRPENADINPNLLHAFIAAADAEQGMDQMFNQAAGMYRAHEAAWAQAHGGAAPTTEQLAASTGQRPAPNVLGSDTVATGAVPVQKEYRGQQGLDDAINDFMAANRRNGGSGAPPIG